MVDLDHLEQEVENLDSQVFSTLIPQPNGKGKKEGPIDMDMLKDIQRPHQGPLNTPEEITKDKRDKKNQLRRGL